MSENGNSKTGLNWPTVALIALTGGANLFTTQAGNNINEAELRRATEEIHALYPKLTEAIERQKRMQESLDHLKSAQ